MKHVLAALIILATCCQLALAQTVRIDSYADANRTSCELTDQGTTVRTVYLFAIGNTSIRGVRFYMPMPECWVGATWFGDLPTQPAATYGNSQTDYDVAFGICRPLPFLVAQINYIATGGSLPCCPISAKDPGPLTDSHGQVTYRFYWIDCIYGQHTLQPGHNLVINSTASCRCDSPVAIESSTWGRVKSLYR